MHAAMVAADDTQLDKEIAMRSSRSLKIVLGLAAAVWLAAPGQAQSGKGEPFEYWIMASEFAGTVPELGWRYYNSEYWGLGLLHENSLGSAVARVNLPAGAVLTQIACHVDNWSSSIHGPGFFLRKVNFDESQNLVLPTEYPWADYQGAAAFSHKTTVTTPADFQHVIQDRNGSIVSTYLLYAQFEGPQSSLRGCKFTGKKPGKGGA
jgi:hypothetical protein